MTICYAVICTKCDLQTARIIWRHCTRHVYRSRSPLHVNKQYAFSHASKRARDVVESTQRAAGYHEMVLKSGRSLA
jgi:hypothetical protein